MLHASKEKVAVGEGGNGEKEESCKIKFSSLLPPLIHLIHLLGPLAGNFFWLCIKAT
jgi:hypothetical protein